METFLLFIKCNKCSASELLVRGCPALTKVCKALVWILKNICGLSLYCIVHYWLITFAFSLCFFLTWVAVFSIKFIITRALARASFREPYCSPRHYYYYSKNTFLILPVCKNSENSPGTSDLGHLSGISSRGVAQCLYSTPKVSKNPKILHRQAKFSPRINHANMHKKASGHGARSTGSCPFCRRFAILPISTPRISTSSSYSFHAAGFKLGQVSLESWGGGLAITKFRFIHYAIYWSLIY